MAVEYINKTTQIQNVFMKDIISNIQEPVISGLLLSKISLAGNYGVEFTVDPKSRLSPLPLYIDETMMVNILGNLINNAIEAASQNDGVNRKKVKLLIVEDKKGIKITIKDNGVGMTEEVSRNIFKPNFSTKSAKRGLGLYNLKKSLDLLDGTVRVATAQNKGSSFFVFIPFKGGKSNEQH
ncbi:Sensor protein CitS [bioreactor metagenome]|uniref:Sensor protein CitS n=1 Tax=bioreactor metagenome TaxID=1076179 RepID=A0A645I738_9ZZZZ